MEKKEESLDPEDWEAFRKLAHKVVDDSVDYLRNVRDRPVWRSMPEAVLHSFDAPLPKRGTDLGSVYEMLLENLLPYPMGNVHPRFWMWYMGSSNATGALGDFLAAIIGSNLGGGNHAAAMIDRQVVNWCKQMVGFPAQSSGTLVSGGSMANILGLAVARNTALGCDVREDGLWKSAPLRFYGSDQLHGCHQRAVELLGMGNKALRRIPTDDRFRMKVDQLHEAIRKDRDGGFVPACVVATAGTVNTGAIDDLDAIRALCEEEGLWFHVDGCIGALMALAPENGHLVRGIGEADSLALDPHKLLHAPFEVGCVLVRDSAAHRGTFALHSEYLEKTARGIAAADWLHDYGVQTSRGFRALKVWMALMENGSEKFGRLIDQNIAHAQHFADRIADNPCLELMAPVETNIVCFRYRDDSLDEGRLHELNREIMLTMQEDGIAAVSDTTIHGRYALRAAFANHRTRLNDVDLLESEVVRLGNELSANSSPQLSGI